jgi:hypothetical protein
MQLEQPMTSTVAADEVEIAQLVAGQRTMLVQRLADRPVPFG